MLCYDKFEEVKWLGKRYTQLKVLSESEVTQSCPTLFDPMDCSLPGSSIHGIFPGKNTGVSCHFKNNKFAKK